MAYAGDLKSLAARIVGSSPTAPTIWSFRARVPQGCGPVLFGRRWDSNPRGGERQADAQRPQRAGEGAGRRPKPVRICAANTRTSHRPYHMELSSPCPQGMRARFFWTPSTAEQLIWDGAFLTIFSAHPMSFLPHFPLEKRGYLAHFPMEKRGCLTHFPMETPKWSYTSREGWEAICNDSL